MKRTTNLTSRRAFIQSSLFGLGAIGAGALTPQTSATETTGAALPDWKAKPPTSEISTRYTNSKQRFSSGPSIPWAPLSGSPSADSILLIPANKFQEILGFGGCFSDAACNVMDQLHEPLRDQLLHELFHPSEMALNVNRTYIGSADSAVTLYSYDEGDPDPELKRFSIDYDRKYILPILRRVRQINPEVFYFSSPWSPPGWMKWNKSMLGGAMSRQYLASYAQYFLRFLQAYSEAGVPIQAITVQNEIDTDQRGLMPACTWSQETETEFITDHLGPLFEKNNWPARIWILDHNYVYWGRVASELDNPDFRRYTTSVAWHPYVGEPSMMSKLHSLHPEAEMYFTEGSTDYNDPHYQDDWTKWSKTYTDVLGNWCRCAVAWNMATDENGKPNIGPYPCGGILIINPRKQEIIRSGQYWALAHFSKTIRRGGRRFESQSQASNLSHVAVENPDGQKVLVITNLGSARTVQVIEGLSSAMIHLEENSIATLSWK